MNRRDSAFLSRDLPGRALSQLSARPSVDDEFDDSRAQSKPHDVGLFTGG